MGTLKEIMMSKYILSTKYLTLILCVSILFSCKNHEDEYHKINDKIEAKSKDYNGTPITSDKYIDHVETIEITEGEHTFLIPERKGQLQSYNCTECHTKPLTEMQKNNESYKKAHWNISLNHANENTMNCITCHNGKDMDNLHSLTGNQIDFNKSYILCSQCHTKQFDDWKGGAHGKRIGGWAPPRASLTCVNCHNPHKPHIESKWPVRFNTQVEKERK